MKATELMMGDWANLTYKNGYGETISKNFRVTQIRESAFRNVAQEAWSDDGNMGDNINGIPLTPEILEKNGWKEAQFWHEYQEGKNTIQACLPDMRGRINGIEIQHFNCEYVHQYQHLLRLCGLNELADNFIVE